MCNPAISPAALLTHDNDDRELRLFSYRSRHRDATWTQ